MMSNVLKCGKCNIVICELLAFIQNKIDVMDEPSIVKICSSAFKADEIVEAKKLLYDSVPTKSRRIVRKKEGKDLEDMICVLKQIDPDLIPIFVARDLYKLPPVDSDHLDAMNVMKNIQMFRCDLQRMRETYVTKEEAKLLRDEVENLKLASLVNAFELDYNNVNTGRRGACRMDDIHYDSSGPEESHFSQDSKSDDGVKSHQQQDDRHVAKLPAKPTSAGPADKTGPPPQAKSTPPRSTANPAVIAPNTVRDKKKRDTEAKEPQQKGWKEVNYKKKRSRDQKRQFTGKHGSAQVKDCDFKAADSKVPIFITNVHIDTSDQDITDYIRKKTKEEVSLVQLTIRNPRHKAYKLFVPRSKLNVFLNGNFWPDGVYFRRFINTKRDTKQPEAANS